MSGDKNLFEQIAEIKADTEAVKTLPKHCANNLIKKILKYLNLLQMLNLYGYIEARACKRRKKIKS